MAATSSRDHRLWHPTRGISFAPGPASPASGAPNARSMADSPAGASQNLASLQPNGTPDGDAIAITHEAPTPRAQSILLDPGLQTPAETAGLCASVQVLADIEADVEANELDKTATDDPPPAVLEYKMEDDLFYAAKQAPLGSPASFWSYKQYRRTADDGSLQKVTVHYCRTKHTMERVCKQYFMDEKVLGFDLEWMADSTRRDGVKKNVSLIQLASPSRIALFHVSLFTDTEEMVGPSFRSLMEDPNVFKVGVSIKGDTTRLRRYLDIDSQGLMELSHLYKLVTYSRNGQHHNINKRLVPLAKQVEEYLHLPLFKGQDVRASNWSKPLDWDQVLYSASDAYAGLQLYLTLDHHRKQLDPCPPSPHRAELNLAIRLADGIKAARSTETLEIDEVTSNDCVAGLPEETTVVETVGAENIETVSLTTLRKTRTSIASKEKSASISPTPKLPEPPKDSRVEVAEDRAASYRTSHPKTRSSFAQLRAYFLWHCYDLPPSTIAQLLRDPPLKTLSVVQYIIFVVQAEKLPVDRDRLREVASFLPQNTLWGRFPVVAGMVAPTEA
ncbi:ribonuclease H-like protein [Xylaria bambusicola]|uniref:ribonuclease H-like protein n=1 Tax=Xylaria bambusicola TaxID=326684 RepID=UPI002008B2D5|nr:ribonuclease H-like protein [Xylaria bambusicola]KAI0525326.1 ribonuclease H-like protein [Xylaria bambusicola]